MGLHAPTIWEAIPRTCSCLDQNPAMLSYLSKHLDKRTSGDTEGAGGLGKISHWHHVPSQTSSNCPSDGGKSSRRLRRQGGGHCKEASLWALLFPDAGLKKKTSGPNPGRAQAGSTAWSKTPGFSSTVLPLSTIRLVSPPVSVQTHGHMDMSHVAWRASFLGSCRRNPSCQGTINYLLSGNTSLATSRVSYSVFSICPSRS